jgi:hypothetical protein
MTAPSAKRGVAIEQAVAYGLLTAVGLGALVLALGYGLFKDDLRVGPGLVPAVVGGLMVLIGGWELIATLRGRRTSHDSGLAEIVSATAPEIVADAPGEDPSTQGSSPGDTPNSTTAPDDAPRTDSGEEIDIFGRTARQRSRQLAVVSIALIVTVLLVPVLGFLGAFLLLSVFISAVVEKRRWLPSVLISVIAVVLVYALFVGFLRVPLPGGLIGIGG